MKMMEILNFDPKGGGQGSVAVTRPIGAMIGSRLAEEAIDMTGKKFPNTRAHNNRADAFRHALWSYLMTENMGPESAKRFADGHEITKPGPLGETIMDIYNNNMGRLLALDPANIGRAPEDVIMEALRLRKLQTRPFNIGTGPR